VYLSGADRFTREVYCWNTTTGALVWKQSIPLAADAPPWPPRVTDTVGLAASTMAANGTAVFATFANGDLTALSHDGKILWSRRGGELRLNYGYASSPAVTDSAVIVQVDQEAKGTLAALRASDGAVLWETPREVSSSWASPTLAQEGGRLMIVAQGTPILAAYDAAKGKELWQTPGMMGENAPSPACASGRVFASNQLLSMSAVDAKTGKVLWETYDGFPDVASPVASADLVLMAASYGVVTCLDAAGGTRLWSEEIATTFYASPLVAAGRFYLLDRSGVMRIFAAARTKKLIGSPAIGEPTEATPAFHDGAIYIRGSAHLFRIGGSGGK
jgi:outer membrane protein assembly factor BamB